MSHILHSGENLDLLLLVLVDESLVQHLLGQLARVHLVQLILCIQLPNLGEVLVLTAKD